MADITKTIRLSIEGQDQVTALKAEIQKLKEELFALANAKLKPEDPTKDLKQGVFQYQSILKEVTEAQKRLNAEIRQTKRDMKFGGEFVELGSIDALQGKLDTLNARLRRTATDSEAFQTLAAQVKLAEAEVKNANAIFNKSTGRMSSMAIAGQNLNFVIRDSPYFFKNFQLGVLSIGNNLDPLIESMKRANDAAKAMGSTFTKELLGFLKGPGGIIVLVSLAVAAFQALTFALSKTKDEAAETTSKIDLLREAVNRLIKVKMPFDESVFNIDSSKLESVIAGIDKQIKEIDKNTKAIDLGATTGKGATAVKLNMEALKEANQNNLEANKKVAEVLKQQKAELEAQLRIAKVLKELGLNPEDKRKAKTARGEDILDVSHFEQEFAKYRDLTGQTVDAYEEILKKQAESLPLMLKQTADRGEQLKIMREMVSIEEKLKSIEDKRNKEEEKRTEYIKKNALHLFGGFMAEPKDYEKFLKKNEADRERQKKARENAEKDIADVRLRYDAMQESKSDSIYILHQKERLKKELEIYSEEKGRELGLELEFQETRKYLSEYYGNLIAQAQLRQFNKTMDAAAQLGNALQQAFSKTGDDFISKLNQALQIALNIAKAIEAVKTQNTTANILGLIGSIVSIIPFFFHEGGIVKAHNGLLANDEVPIIARKGEMIFNTRQQENLFNLINNPGTRDYEYSSNPVNISIPIILDGKKIAENQYKYLPQQLGRIIRERIPLN